MKNQEVKIFNQKKLMFPRKTSANICCYQLLVIDMKNQEVEDSQSKEADVSKKNFSQYLLLPTPKGGVCGDYPHVYIS